MEILRKYNTESTIVFPLVTKDAPDFITGATFASGDGTIVKNEGTPASTANTPTSEGNGWYSLVLTATEMTAARICISIIDQTNPKAFEDQAIVVQTYGHASAGIVFDLSTAIPDVNVNTISNDAVSANSIATAAVTKIQNGLATDSVVTAIKTTTDKIDESSSTIVSSSAKAGTLTTTSMTTNLTETTDDHYNGRAIIWTSGVLKDQARVITGYVGSSKSITFADTTDTVSASDTFIIV